MIYPLPPILQTRGLKILEMGEDTNGAYLKFGVQRGKVRSVTVYMKAPNMIQWKYVYSIYDPETRTVLASLNSEFQICSVRVFSHLEDFQTSSLEDWR